MRRVGWLFLVAACRRPTPDAAPDPAGSKAPVAVVDAARPVARGLLIHACAPWDGPALRIVIADGATCAAPAVKGRVDVTVYRDLPEPTTKLLRRWTFGTSVDVGHARWVEGTAEELVGWVELDGPQTGTVRGRMRLQGKGLHEAELVLAVCPGEPMCG